MKFPKLSIIMSVLNGEEFFEKSLHSILSQNYKNLELIIIDGGSKDNTINIIQSVLENISVFITEEDRNMWHAYNKGIMKAQGEFIGFLPADDFYSVDAFYKVAQHIIQNPEAQFIYGNANRINEDGKFLSSHGAIPFNKNILLHNRCYIPHQSVFIRKDVFPIVGLFDTTLKWNGDWDFWKRCAVNNIKFSFLDENIGNWRLHRNTVTYGGGSREYFLRSIETFNNARKYSEKLITPIEIRLIPHIFVGLLGLRIILRGLRNKIREIKKD